MKKLFFTLTLMLAGLTATAQQQDDYQLPDGILAMELQVNPFSNDFNTFKMAQLKARLFLDNKNVIRFGFGIGLDNDKNENTQTDDSRGIDKDNYILSTSSTTTKTNKTELKFSLGYENHFAQAGRLDFYAGAEAGYEGKYYSGSSSQETKTETVSNASGTRVESNSLTTMQKDYEKMLPDASKYNEHNFFANVFTGVDFYIYKGLYIGTELGLSFKTGKEKNGSWTESQASKSFVGSQTTADWTETFSSKTGLRSYVDNLDKDNNSTTNEQILDHSATNTKLKIYVEPALRIGWIF